MLNTKKKLFLKVVAIIPARYNSSRFPGKLLEKLNEKSILENVFQKASSCKSVDKVFIATDSKKILDHALSFTPNVIMTSSDHESGTDRCFEAYHKIGKEFDVLINLQGDEPLITDKVLDSIINLMQEDRVQIGTLSSKITSEEELFNKNVVKVISDINNKAIYFSREALPFLRDISKEKWLKERSFYKHIGIYAFKVSVIKKLAHLEKTSLEEAEKLEQLRWVENGLSMYVGNVEYDGFGIDTPEDLEMAKSK